MVMVDRILRHVKDHLNPFADPDSADDDVDAVSTSRESGIKIEMDTNGVNNNSVKE